MEEYMQQLQQLNNTPSQSLRILDARPHSAYLRQRLQNSVNINLLQLTSRCFLLPGKPTPFAVVIPSQSTYRVTADASQHGQQLQDGSVAVYLKGTESLQEFLTSRGWTVTQYLADSPQLWAAAAELGLLEQQDLDPQLLAKRCLFSPSQLLFSSIAEVEHRLAARHACSMRQQQQHQAAAQGATPGSSPCHLVLRALDVGCGSGRDAAWLVSRQQLITLPTARDTASGAILHEDCPCDSQQQCAGAALNCQQVSVQLSWHVTGLDEWLGALERAHQLAQGLQLTREQIQLVYGAVSKETGYIQLLHLPKTSKLQSASHAAVVHADVMQRCASASDQVVEAEMLSMTQRVAGLPKPGSAVTAEGTQDSTLWHLDGKFDMILCVRFLERSLLPRLCSMLYPGGFILFSTFVDGPGLRAFGRPSGPDHVLQPGELASVYFGPQQGFSVVEDRVVLSGDGRELCHFVAKMNG